MPQVYIIAGPNGAGKTTASMSLLPEILSCMEYINSDSIAYGLCPFDPSSVAIDSGRIMLSRIKKLISERKDFAFETTLATRSFAKLIKDCKKLGYTTNIIYFWLPSCEFAINRVRERVSQGGHDIPVDTIKRRYKRSLHNLVDLYFPIVDNVLVYNSSLASPTLVAEKFLSGDTKVSDLEIWDKINAK